MTVAEKLIAEWKRQGLPIASGCPLDSIREFEARNRVQFPADMKEYLLAANGMIDTWPGGCDADGFSFWSLSRLVPVGEIVEEQRSSSFHHFASDGKFFVFADYMDWSWAYAIGLAADGNGRVILIGKASPEVVAESFSEFVDLYADHSRRLYEGIVVESP